jgi:hypothetical protein
MFCLALVAGLLVSGKVHAQPTYEYIIVPSSSPAIVGSPLTMSVYLQTNAAGAALINNNNGLGSFGIYVTSSGANSSSAVFTPASPFLAGGGFYSSNSLGAGSGLPANSFDYFASVSSRASQGAFVNTNTDQLLLGTFSVTVSHYGLTSFTIQPDTQSPGNGDYAGIPFGDNDLQTVGTGGAGYGSSSLAHPTLAPTTTTMTVNVNAIPEPTSFLLCGLAASGMGLCTWVGRKKKAVVSTTDA